MPWIPIAAAVIGAAGSAYSANKAAQAQKEAAKLSQVDIGALDAKTREIALRNAQESAALEKLMTPEVPALRAAANQGVINSLGDNSAAGAQKLLQDSLGGNVSSPLLQAAIAKAKANLELGGQLDRDTQNAVTRRGLAGAASSTGNLGLGRDVVARDLGLTSLQLQQQRLNDASKIGGQESDMAFNNSANLLNRIQLLRSISDSGFSRNLQAAQFGQSIAPPVVGLDPSAVANVVVGNANNQGAAAANRGNIYGQQGQNYANLAGSALGYGLLQYNGQQPTQTGGNSAYNDMYASMTRKY